MLLGEGCIEQLGCGYRGATSGQGSDATRAGAEQNALNLQRYLWANFEFWMHVLPLMPHNYRADSQSSSSSLAVGSKREHAGSIRGYDIALASFPTLHWTACKYSTVVLSTNCFVEREAPRRCSAALSAAEKRASTGDSQRAVATAATATDAALPASGKRLTATAAPRFYSRAGVQLEACVRQQSQGTDVKDCFQQELFGQRLQCG